MNKVIGDGRIALLEGKRTFGDLMGDTAREVGWFQIVDDLYNQAMKFGLQPGKMLKKFELGIREREMIMGKEERGIGNKRKKKNRRLRGQQVHSFNRYLLSTC